MGNLSSTRKTDILPEFQTFLLNKKMVPEKNVFFYMALKEKVSASTQNQAFNAILFLFRNVLCKNLGDLTQTVRAKRGQKLPVVFSVEEVRRLLACLTAQFHDTFIDERRQYSRSAGIA